MLTHHYAEVNGLKLHYASQGEGKLIMFVHGFPEFWYAWKAQLTEFGRDYHVVAPDLRGYNLSAKPEGVEAYQAKHSVEDLRALVDVLGYRKFTLVAHDWGGAIAWLFAVTYPQRLQNLIIINAPHPAMFARELQNNPQQLQASTYMNVLASPDAETLLRENGYARLVAMVLQEGLNEGYFTTEDKAVYLKAWSQPGALTGSLNYYRASPLRPPTTKDDTLHHINPKRFAFTVLVPTLVIWGERDTAILTGNLDGLADLVPDIIIKRVPDASHWVVHQKPALVNQYIRAFLAI